MGLERLRHSHLLQLFVSSFSPYSCYTGCHPGEMFGRIVGEQGEDKWSVCGYEVSQAWLRHSLAEALFSGTISSMGRRKWVKWPASSCDQPYFSTSTSNRDHGFSLVMCRSSPAGGNRERCQHGIRGRNSLVWLVHPNDKKHVFLLRGQRDDIQTLWINKYDHFCYILMSYKNVPWLFPSRSLTLWSGP